ncbi:MAG: efflux RND transporter permease subunit [Rhodospirillaceae bacterium]
MLLSDISIRRPVVAIVVSLLLVVFGFAGGMRLPVRETPDIDIPTVFVNVSYPGASAEVVETKVVKLIEQQIGSITGLKTIRSFARDNFAGFNLEFVVGHDLDEAANDIRDQLGRITGRLPQDANPPVIQKQDSDNEPIVNVTFYSTKRSQLEVTDYLTVNVQPRLSTIPGIAAVDFRNARQKSLRIWLDRRAMAARELTVTDVETALRRENVELGAGMLESAERNYTMRTLRTFRTTQDFENLVIGRGANNYLIRLGEIAKVEIGAVDERSLFRQDGKLGTGMMITKQPGASTLDVSNAVVAELEEMKKTLPSDFEVAIAPDSAEFIERALHEVTIAIGVAGLLVVTVIYLFLGTFRAALIPAVTVPISLIGTGIVLAPLGFSINILTLLALVLAIGLVVDDAIIMLENIHRRMKMMNEPPLLAAFRGAKQVGTAILSTTMVLVAAFVPVMLMPGTIGTLFFEFAVTMAVAVAFSMFVSLTLTPVMCAKILTPDLDHSPVAHKAEEIFERMKAAYARSLDKVLNRPALVFAAFGAITVAVIGLFQVLPQEFAPREDRGSIDIQIRSPEGATLAYTQKIVEQVAALVKPIAEKGEVLRIVERVQSPGNEGGLSIRLVDWGDRRPAQEIVTEISPLVAKVPGAQISVQLRGGQGGRGGGGGNFISFSVAGPTFEELREWRDKITVALQASPMIAQVRNNFIETKPQIRIRINQARAADLGVSVGAIGQTLAAMMGSRRVTTFVDAGEEYDVLLQGSLADRQTPTDVSNIYVRSDTTRELIPLASVVTLEEGTYAENLSRIDRKRAVSFFINPVLDVKLSELISEVESKLEPILPETAELVWRGEAQDFKETGYLIYISFGLALIVVFLVLAAQFESFIHPLVILMTVPLAVFGALLGLLVFGQSINIYSQVGIIVLVGLAAKNGILIVEFANQLRDAGRPFREALVEGAMIRLRPIVMTALATVMGALPLVLATGAGAEGRRPLGVTIFTGVTFAAFVTLFVIPAFYMLLARNTGSPGRVAAELRDFERRHPLTGKQADDLGHQPAE